MDALDKISMIVYTDSLDADEKVSKIKAILESGLEINEQNISESPISPDGMLGHSVIGPQSETHRYNLFERR